MSSHSELSPKEQKFYDYCRRKIDAAIDKQSSDAEILFSELKEMRAIGSRCINVVYRMIEAYYFNIVFPLVALIWVQLFTYNTTNQTPIQKM